MKQKPKKSIEASAKNASQNDYFPIRISLQYADKNIYKLHYLREIYPGAYSVVETKKLQFSEIVEMAV